jgi:hypothetical protein
MDFFEALSPPQRIGIVFGIILLGGFLTLLWQLRQSSQWVRVGSRDGFVFYQHARNPKRRRWEYWQPDMPLTCEMWVDGETDVLNTPDFKRDR